MIHILPGTPPLSVQIRQNAQAKVMRLRIGTSDQSIRLTLPKGCSAKEARDFLLAQEEKIRATLAVIPTRETLEFGKALPVLGKILYITPHQDKLIRQNGESLLVAHPQETLGLRVAAYLKTLAHAHICTMLDEYKDVGLSFRKLSLRDPKTRWGSCNSQGNLMFSWRLIMAPPDVLRYVVVHELAHLRHLDHSSAFWSLVETLFPSYHQGALWLKTHGIGLHRIDFNHQP